MPKIDVVLLSITSSKRIFYRMNEKIQNFWLKKASFKVLYCIFVLIC